MFNAEKISINNFSCQYSRKIAILALFKNKKQITIFSRLSNFFSKVLKVCLAPAALTNLFN